MSNNTIVSTISELPTVLVLGVADGRLVPDVVIFGLGTVVLGVFGTEIYHIRNDSNCVLVKNANTQKLIYVDQHYFSNIAAIRHDFHATAGNSTTLYYKAISSHKSG